jgi:hypothetical protein
VWAMMAVRGRGIRVTGSGTGESGMNAE